MYCQRLGLTVQDATSNPPEQSFSNVGDSDAATDTMSSAFLLVRNLESNTSEEVLAKGMAKLVDCGEDEGHDNSAGKPRSTTAPDRRGAHSGSLRRVFLVRDRQTKDCWRFGFAEFHSVEVRRMFRGKRWA